VRRIAIAIAGASCSGKTTLAESISRTLGATLIRVDDYYRPLDDICYADRCRINFDHPDTIDHERLTADVRALLDGQAVEAPVYDFTRHTRFEYTERVEPNSVIIVEGLFALCYPALVELCDVRIFVEAPHEVCLERRIVRDVASRGRTEEEVTERYHQDVLPMYEQHIGPSGAFATVRVSGVNRLEL